MPDPELEILPKRGQALRWAVVGALASNLSLAAALQTGESLSWILFAVSVTAAAFPLAQLFIPRAFRLTLGPDGLRSRSVLHWVETPWDRVHDVHHGNLFGDSWLRVKVVRRTAGAWRPQTRWLQLPLGADMAALDRTLDHYVDPPWMREDGVARDPQPEAE